jgi:hypothetical protein
MKRLTLACLALTIIAVGLSTRPAGAQDAGSILDHYRVLPRFSTVHQTGGIAGFDIRYRLMGAYDLVHGVAASTNTAGTRAKFANADIWGNPISDGPVPAIVLDVDEVLNLERLKGESLPVAAPFDVYRFTGETSDGSSVNLFASVIGPWMYLRGGTQPPPGSADFFKYQVQWLARSRPFADFNDDGRVDAADFVLRRKADAAGTTFSPDDISSGAGIDDWRLQFGETVPDLAAMDRQLSVALGSGSAIPEPTSAALLTIGVLLGCRLFRRA